MGGEQMLEVRNLRKVYKTKKGADVNATEFYTASGDMITINTGKTYVALVASYRWDELVLE